MLVIDEAVQNFLTVSRTPMLNDVFRGITVLGKWEIVLGMAILVSLFFWRRRLWTYAGLLWGALLFNQASVFVVKRLADRDRPLDTLLDPEPFSFPSGHAAISMVFFGLLIYLISENVASIFWKKAAIFVSAALILLIGFSRLYLGAHFLTDVIGGYVVGLFWIFIGVKAHKKYKN